jgi:uncharacterized Zn finger protein
VISKLSEATIRRHANAKSYDRGQGYYQSGAVESLVQRGNTVSGWVEGSEVEPYQVTLCFDKGGITAADCTCPYDFDGWCKHIVATLLTCLHHPDEIEQRPELTELLTPLSHEQLKAIVQSLAEEHPKWIDAIEQQIIQQTLSKATKKQKTTQRRTAVDPKPIERQVRGIINEYSGQWNDYPAFEEIEEILLKADGFLEQGDGNNALMIIGAVVRAYVEDWMNLDGSSGESGAFFEILDASMTEAILSVELSKSDRQQWQQELEEWQSEVQEYGVDNDFAMSLTALEQGWDYPPLQRVFAGKITELGAWEDESPYFADDLAKIRLQILERQGREQDYLYLAQAEGQTDRYLRMLAKLGRTEEAIAEAQEQMTTATEALTLAKMLREQGHLEQALSIATQGLSLKGSQDYQLAIWTSELAEGMDAEVALEARLKAFRHFPSLEHYVKLQELAGADWNSLQKKLLKRLRQDKSGLNGEAKVDIFMAEGLLDDAIATADQLSSYQSNLIHPVMDAAISHNPEWVIENAQKRAESIMDGKQAKYYHHAANWLRKVRAAYLHQGKATEWKCYLKELMQTHSRKPKLLSYLKQRDLA